MEDKFLRLPQVLEIIPISRSGWYAGVASGKFPKPTKLGHRTAVWRASEVQALVEEGLPQGKTLLN